MADKQMNCVEMRRLLKRYKGDIGCFARHLISEHVPHISYSIISTYEFCPRRYELEYIKGVELDPLPGYFVKGRMFHEIAARHYARVKACDRRGLADVAMPLLRSIENDEDRTHVENALCLLERNMWHGWEIVGIEKIFVMRLHQHLPPLVGVIDLLLRKGGKYAVVDHKTGRNFWWVDPLQVTIYREFVRKVHHSTNCAAYNDEYRWVNSLERIRTPAFSRSRIAFGKRSRERMVKRALDAYKGMTAIVNGGKAQRSGECYMCPYKSDCW